MPAEDSQLHRLRQGLGRMRARIELLINGSAPSDPLYLSNRTWQQKLKNAALVSSPVLILIALILIASTDVFRIHKADPYGHTLAEVQPAAAQKRLPEPKLAPAPLEVVNIRIAKDTQPPVVTGILRNNTNARVRSVEVSYFLADDGGSLIGSDITGVQNLQPHGSVTFRSALKITNAEYVIVREVRSN
ncbi:MAG TPA: FxLYD domain-containing protein [Bryobacteraceae bacterium]|nr:FxLYD domain-containing protein [Bryobacteraceae bacterium]